MASAYGILGYPSDWSLNYGSAGIPPDYFLPAITPGFRVTRRRIKRDVDTTMPTDYSQPIVRWKIPSASATILDFRRAVVYVTISASATGGAAWLSNLAWNIFERCRLEQAGNYVEDRRYFNLQETIEYMMKTHLLQKLTTGVHLYGYGDIATRTAHAGGWRYALPIPFSCLTKAVLPFFQLSNDGMGIQPMNQQDLILQWELSPPTNVVEVAAGATVPYYQITKMEVEYDEITLEGGPAPFVSKWFMAANKMPQVLFRSYLTNIYQLSTGTEQDILIDLKVQSLISLWVVFRSGTTVTTPTVYDKFETFPGPNIIPLLSFQWEVNGVLWPDKIIQLTSPTNNPDTFVVYEQTMQIFHSRRVNEEVTPITYDQWLNDKFVMMFDANMHPFSMNLLSPLSTQKGNTQIHLRLQFTAAPPANLTLVVHALHHKIWNYNTYANKGLIVEN
jgi:hypothetical protein